LPVFAVSVPVQREVTDYVEYTGRTGAKEAEEIKARVTGLLVDFPFEEGTEIKKGDVLFKIDPRPYQVQYDQAEAQVRLYDSQLSWPRRIISAISICSSEPRAPESANKRSTRIWPSRSKPMPP
jgi:multidrug efflux pump subunit AcrA (membrane-fusion protein)